MALKDYLLEILSPSCYVDDNVELPFNELGTLVDMYMDETEEYDILEILDIGSAKQALRGCIAKSFVHFDFVTNIHNVLKDLALELQSQVEDIHEENAGIEKNG